MRDLLFPARHPARDRRFVFRRWRRIAGALVVAALPLTRAAAQPAGETPESESAPVIVTNMSQVLSNAALPTAVSLPVLLEATVAEADAQVGFADLVDDSDMGRIEIDLREVPLAAGQRIRIKGRVLFGNGRAVFENNRIKAGPPLIDNDGRHSNRELSGSARLSAGKHRLRLTYFQFSGPRALSVRYSGPGISKQAIPPTALFHAVDPAGGEREYHPGVRCEYYPRSSQTLPNFPEWRPLRTAVVPNFAIPPFVRSNSFALQFVGHIHIEREGNYTFYLASDDGSQLFLEPETPARVEVLGLGDLVEVSPARIGRTLPPEEDGRMMEVAGTVTFISESPEQLLLELSDETAFMQLRVPGVRAVNVPHLLGCKVRARGRAVRLLNLRGEGSLGALTLSGLESLYVERVPESLWRETPARDVTDLATNRSRIAPETVVQVQGKVLRQVPGSALIIGDHTTNVEVRSNQRELVAAGAEVRAIGSWQPSSPHMVLVQGFFEVKPDGAESAQRPLPLLTTGRQVHSLSADEASQQYPVRLKAVITSSNPMRVQDITRGVFVERSLVPALTNARIGELFEIEGVTTAGRFAPNVEPHAASLLGPAQMPKPVRPTYEQFMSLGDTTQWAELEGVLQSVLRVSGATTKILDLQLATKGGPVFVRIAIPRNHESFTNHLDDVAVRLRGTISAQFNEQRQARGAYLTVPSPIHVCILRRGPADSFSLPTQPIRALMQFDSKGGLLHRVKVEGQVTHIRGDTWFLMDDTGALTFRPRTSVKAAVGDRVAVTGYQDLSGRAPLLREALVRKLGNSPLATPRVCTLEELMSGRFNNERVRLVANVVSLRTNGAERVFELQSDLRSFHARQEMTNDKLEPIPKGSQVEITGICAGNVSRSQPGEVRGGMFTDIPLDSFDLLLNSTADIRLLQPPPRWTLREALALSGALAAIVLVAMLWIHLLRRRVAERTAQLEAANKELEAFSYSVSHDLRAPLRGIDGFSRAVLEENADKLDEEGRLNLERVRQASQRMEGLIDDLLMLSSVSRREMLRSTVDLSTLARTIAQELQASDPSRSVQFVIASDLKVKADPNLTRIALENLLRNSWKYTGKHPTARIEFGVLQESGRPVYFVRDDGAGFEMEYAGKLFGAFQRLHPAAQFPGTGIGLATVKRIIHRHGGRVWAEGAVEKGATFYFTIPD